MTTAPATEPRRVARKRPPRPPQQAEHDADPPFDRIELQAPLGWAEEVDKAAAALGLSRSAYIRLAVNERMTADRRARG